MERGGIDCSSGAWDDLDLIDINSFIDGVGLPNSDDTFYWNQPLQRSGVKIDASFSDASVQDKDYAEVGCSRKRSIVEIDASFSGASVQDKECAEVECPRKRGRADGSCARVGSKACRERLRREKLNERFAELCSTLEPGRPVKTDKLAILGDAIRVLNQLRSEAQEYKEMNEKLAEEIQTLKADKNELREEKILLKAEKEKMEQQLRTVAVPPPTPAFMAPHPAAYPAGMNKMGVFPGYGFMPMYHYLPPSSRDTTQDHELRPPAA